MKATIRADFSALRSGCGNNTISRRSPIGLDAVLTQRRAGRETVLALENTADYLSRSHAPAATGARAEPDDDIEAACTEQDLAKQIAITCPELTPLCLVHFSHQIETFAHRNRPFHQKTSACVAAMLKCTPLATWAFPPAPWERIHLDTLQVYNEDCPVVVDAHSKWLECFKLGRAATTAAALERLSELMAGVSSVGVFV
ncbi:hypothetical protein EVAR_27038_1 [Eumeta japonica]|uniref:Uncharacterized protein n=1 Tax=Eumeta variegata TaxID=151549 RepID=A0A4C1WD63_EUMVA|nr:hypothetical protein EVAR_27038_1 [Eumeta japonica]